jgi:aryl-alcohol dehydrogenase-like predicted oxidoreductase
MTPNFNWQENGPTHFRKLGRTGVWVPKLCLGAMNFGAPTPEDESIRIIHAALDAGLTFIDTANVYNGGESERIVGKALAGRRDQVILATKVFNAMGDGPNDRGLSRYHIMRACEDSLRRLQTDHIDLYQLHRPDFDLPLDETLRALDDLVQQGKVRYLGVSTFPAWLTVEAIHVSERLGLHRFISEQPPYNLADRRVENTILPMCQRYGLAILAWAPLAGGLLTGKYPLDDSVPAGTRAADNSFYAGRFTHRARAFGADVARVAAEAGMTGAQLGLLWVTGQPGVTAAIIGPRTLAHLESALSILDLNLPEEVAQRLDELNPPGDAVADFFNTSRWMKMRV